MRIKLTEVLDAYCFYIYRSLKILTILQNIRFLPLESAKLNVVFLSTCLENGARASNPSKNSKVYTDLTKVMTKNYSDIIVIDIIFNNQSLFK